ncbi:tetratricopeptide repeat protein [Methanofollis fontis]|nr:tetratricopeptide repeat protein [Methanofollis fontis]
MDTTIALNFFREHFWIERWCRKTPTPEETALLRLFLIRRERDMGFAAEAAAAAFADDAAKDAFRTTLAGALATSFPDLDGSGPDAYLWRRYLAFLDESDLNSAHIVRGMLNTCTAETQGGTVPAPSCIATDIPAAQWEGREKRAVMTEIHYPDLYFESSYPGGFPETQIVPADLEITDFAFSCLKNLNGGSIPPGGARTFTRFLNDSATILAVVWFAGREREEQIAILNREYPFRLDEETLDRFVALFDDQETLLEEAAGLVRRGLIEEAETIYAYAIVHSDDSMVHYTAFENLGVLFREAGEHERAIECAERALAIRRVEAESDPYAVALAEKSLAEALYSAGETERAANLTASVEATVGRLDPAESANLLWALGSSFRRTGRFEEEYAALTRILEMEGGENAEEAAMARLFSMDQYARPDGSFDLPALAALEDRRRYLDRFGQGAVLLQAFQFERAIRSFEEALAISHDTDLMRNIAIAHRLYGLPEQGRRYLEEVLRMRPTDTYARIHLGLLDGGAEGTALIRRAIEDAVQEGADLGLILYPLVRDAVVAGTIDAAIEHFANFPTRNGVRALAHLGAGTNLADLGCIAEAERCYRRGLRANPPAPVRARILRNMGALASDAGDLERACSLLEKAQAIAPGDPTILFRLAGVRAGLNDRSGAAEAAREAVRLAPAEERYLHARDLRESLERVAPPTPADPEAADLIRAGEEFLEYCPEHAARAYALAWERISDEAAESPGPEDDLLAFREEILGRIAERSG